MPISSRRRSRRAPWRRPPMRGLPQGEARPLEGIPLGIKDLFATKGVHTQAGSHMLDGFKPTYESTVTANLWRDGAVMLGKLNMDEFAMGSSNETTLLRQCHQSLAAHGTPMPLWCPAALRRLGRGGRRPSSAPAPPPPIPAARSASLPPSPARSASSRPMAAARAGASSLSLPRSIRRGRSRATCAMPPSCCNPWRASIPRTRPRSICRCPITRRRSASDDQGPAGRHPEGIPHRRHAGRNRCRCGRRAPSG